MGKLVLLTSFAFFAWMIYEYSPTPQEWAAIEAREAAERAALLPSPDCVIKDLGSQFGVDHVVAVWCPHAAATTTSTQESHMVGKVQHTDSNAVIQLDEEPH